MDAYSAPLAQPGAPAEKGIYTTASERSKAANQLFTAVAQQYGWLSEGDKAHYFAGVTYEELGQNGPAETELKAAAGAGTGISRIWRSWHWPASITRRIAIAGNRALQRAGRQAVGDGAGGVAQLDLADLYAATGKQDWPGRSGPR